MPGTKHTVTVTYKDLKYLCDSYMLNDTIIDFYLKYIHNEIVPAERFVRQLNSTYALSGLGEPRCLCSTRISTAAAVSPPRRINRPSRRLPRKVA